MTAHRYWRLFISSIVSGSAITAGEIEFRATVGGADLTNPTDAITAAFSSGSPSSGFEARYAFNDVEATAEGGPANTYWSLASGGLYSYIGYDFGAGNEVDVNEVYFYPSRDVNRQPNLFLLQYSDNGTTWFTKGMARNQTGWTLGVARTFNFTPAITSDSRISWAIAQNVPSSLGAAIEEIEFRATVGGADQATGGTPGSTSQFSGLYTPSQAFNNSSSGNPWLAADADIHAVIRYTFGASVVVEQIMLRTDGTLFTRCPTDFSILSSGDGNIFRFEWKETTTWAASQTRTFTRPANAITSIAPTFGDVAGGTAVTLTGTGFTTATDVEFDGVSAANVVVVNDTTITCDTPAHTAGFVDVVVIRPTTNLTLVNGFEYTSIVPPAIVSLSPDEGTVFGGETITITGTNLLTVDGVNVNGIVAAFSIINSTTIEYLSPASAVEGLVDVEITSSYGDDTLVDGFLYTNIAAVTQIPALLVHLPIQAIRVTQVPVLFVHLPIQAVRTTQIPVLPVLLPKPVPLPGPIVPEVPVKEIWQWKTVVNIFEMSKEQRSQLRADPRMSMQFSAYILGETEYRDIWSMLLKYQKQVFNYPMYVYSVQLDQATAAGGTKLYFNPAHTDLRNGEAIALFDKHLVTTIYATVLTVDSDGATLAEPLETDAEKYFFVCPAPRFKMDEPSLSMTSVAGDLSLNLEAAQVRSVLRPGQANAPTLIGGKLLLDVRPLADDGVNEQFDQNMVWLDNGIANPEPRTSWLYPFISGERKFLIHRPGGMDYWRSVASYLKGRQKTFLLPTFRKDLPVIEQPALGATSFKSDSVQFFDIWRSRAWKYIRIQSNAGVIYRSINEVLINYSLATGNPESITVKLSASIGAAAGSNLNMVVSFVNTCRLDSDEIVIEHGDIDSILSMKVRMVEQ